MPNKQHSHKTNHIDKPHSMGNSLTEENAYRVKKSK